MASSSRSGTRKAPDAGPAMPLEKRVHHSSTEVVRGAAADPRLTEDLALALLARRDLPSDVLEELCKNAALMQSRKVLLAAVAHPHVPRHFAVPTVRRLYTFELMQLALSPATVPEMKVSAEDVLTSRLETISSGERFTLAHRASTRVAAALLADSEDRIVRAALDNPYMTEGALLKILMRERTPAVLVQIVCRHSKWSLRRDIRIALLRTAHTPLAHALVFAQSLPVNVLRDVLHTSRLPDKIKAYLLKDLNRRIANS